MQRLADYKVLNDSVVQIGSNQSHTLEFTVSGAVVKTDSAQRPYLLLSEQINGALPATINISLNGSEIDSRNGSANNLLGGPYSHSHMVPLDGNLINVGNNNSLTIELLANYNTTLDLNSVVLNFQREI